ncbi:MAG: DUF4926 domain-containing protein [Janthinobacterium lividum]
MQPSFQLYDVVTLTGDLPQQGLVRGQVGTVVEQYAPDTFEVEFADQSGRTYALTTLKAEHLLVLHYEPAYAV